MQTEISLFSPSGNAVGRCRAAPYYRVESVAPIATWARTLPMALRTAPTLEIVKLAREVLLPQLTSTRGSARFDLVQDAADVLALLAENALSSRSVTSSALQLWKREPRFLDFGLIVATSHLVIAAERLGVRFATPEFYPNQMLANVLSEIAGRAHNPVVAQLFAELAASSASRDVVAALREAAAGLTHSLSPRQPWPGARQAALVAERTAALAPAWLFGATRRIVALEEKGAALGLRKHAQSALGWAQRAEAIFRCLAGTLGWVRLYVAYLCKITPPILRQAQKDPAPVIELSQRDLMWPCARLTGGSSSETEPEPLYREPRFDTAARQRLHRMREQCLDGELEVPSSELIEVLCDFGRHYYGEEAP